MKKLIIGLFVLGSLSGLVTSFASTSIVKASRNCNVALNFSDDRDIKEIKIILEAHKFKVTNDHVNHENFPIPEEFLLSADILGEFPEVSVKFHLMQIKEIDEGGEFINSQDAKTWSYNQARKKLKKLLFLNLPVCSGQ